MSAIPAAKTQIPDTNCTSAPTWANPGSACAHDSLTIGLTCYSRSTNKPSSGCTTTTNVYSDTAGNNQLTLATGQSIVASSSSAGFIATGTPSAAATFGCNPSCLKPPVKPGAGVWVADWVGTS